MYHFTQLRTLALASRDNRIDIACITPEPIAELLRFSPWAGEIIDARSFRRYLPLLRGENAVHALRDKYDTAFVLHRSTSFKLAALSAGIARRIGFEGNFLDRFLLSETLGKTDGGAYRQRWGHRQYIGAMDEWIHTHGFSLDDATPTILADEKQIARIAAFIEHLPRPFIIANGFVQNPARRWPTDHLAACLVSTAEKTGGSIILNAGPDAAAYVAEVTRALDGTGIPMLNSLEFATSIAASLALYHLADLYLGVDSFTANLAYNCNLPAVSIFPKETDALSYKPDISPLFPRQGDSIDRIEIARISDACIKMLGFQARGNSC